MVGATLHSVDVFTDLDKLLDAVEPSSIVVIDASLAQSRPLMAKELSLIHI